MSGRIDLIVGCMFSGKSTELIRRLKRYQYGKKKVIAIRNPKDNRYTTSAELCTHEKQKFINTINATELTQVDIAKYDVIGVDEGQFFNDLDIACEKWANQGKQVIVAMLDGTFERKAFPNGCFARLIPLSESITKLSAVCDCGKDAAFTQLFEKQLVGTNNELVGGSDIYRAVCRACYHEI